MPSNALQDLITQQFLNSNPAAAFYRRFAPQLQSTNQNYNAFLRSMPDDYYNRYMGQLPDNPTMEYTSFLDTLDPEKQFRALAPQQRGERTSQFSPRVRYIS